MGLFDNISKDRATGQMTFTQEVKAFATLDLNSIFREASKAIVDIFSNAAAFFSDVFGSSDCNDQDRVLYERMKDQIPGMIIIMVKLGWEDASNLDAYNDNPNRADYGGRPKGAFPCNDGINPARQLFTTLFGVRILNSNYLDALQIGADAYYNTDQGARTYDIPREAVNRAVMLKQTYFPNATYNNTLWNMNKFQEFPLVAPIPDPVTPAQLFTGNVLGVDVQNGYVIGDPVPDLPTSTNLNDFYLRDFNSPIIYRPGTNNTPLVTPTGTTTNTTETNLSKLITWAKANPVESAFMAAAAAFLIYEIADNA